MSVADERRSLYRDRVLAAAEREFARVGFAETKVAAIARAADVSLATVYKTFPGKTEIWNDLHAERMAALLARVDERVAGIGSPLERLLAGIGAVAEFLTEHDAYLELSLHASAGWLTASSGHGVQQTVWSSGLATIAAGVDAAREAGELADLRPRVAAGLVVSALQVWLADWVDAGRDRAPGVVVEDLVSHLRTMLTR
ncbi:TetR/AcrR family transcriptional regulator [Nocardioides caricicola]|uniref:TetR/AcrR family transcriptional regulator n=1 Tax=Nocardioides caricicola TaxID=634770 RepID=A0ABW0MWG5_9ACTN